MHFWLADRAFYHDEYSWEFVESHYRQALALDPNNITVNLWYGIHLSYRGMNDRAKKQFEIVLAVDPENEQARQALEKLSGIGRT